MSPHENDELGELLTQELHRRTDGLHGEPLAFDDVRGRATSIRRRRRVATGLAAVAAVAVIVPTAVLATSGPRADGPPIASQSPSVTTPSTTPSATASTGPAAHELDVSDLPTGAPPQVRYWATDQNPAQAEARTAEATVRSLSEGVVVTTASETFGPYPSSSGLARNAAGTAVAWTTDDGYLMSYADGAGAPVQVMHSGLASLQVAAVTGTDCVRGRASDCTYYVSGYDTKTDLNESFAVSGDGSLGAVDPDRTIVVVHDATEAGRVLGLTEVTDGGSCSAVLEPGAGADPLFGTCDYTLDAFSPGGEYVLASDPYHSGAGSGLIGIFTSDGELLSSRLRVDGDAAFYSQAVWEDESHVLLTVFQDGAWSIVRMGVDGSLEYAVAPVAGGDPYGGSPWRFETR